MSELADNFVLFARFCKNACLPCKKSQITLASMDADAIRGKVNLTLMSIHEFSDVWSGLHRSGFAKYRELKQSQQALDRAYKMVDPEP